MLKETVQYSNIASQYLAMRIAVSRLSARGVHDTKNPASTRALVLPYIYISGI